MSLRPIISQDICLNVVYLAPQLLLVLAVDLGVHDLCIKLLHCLPVCFLEGTGQHIDWQWIFAVPDRVHLLEIDILAFGDGLIVNITLHSIHSRLSTRYIWSMGIDPLFIALLDCYIMKAKFLPLKATFPYYFPLIFSYISLNTTDVIFTYF